MSLLPASAAAQSAPAGLSSNRETEALQRLFRAAHTGKATLRENTPSSSCDQILAGFCLETRSSDESQVYFAIL